MESAGGEVGLASCRVGLPRATKNTGIGGGRGGGGLCTYGPPGDLGKAPETPTLYQNQKFKPQSTNRQLRATWLPDQRLPKKGVKLAEPGPHAFRGTVMDLPAGGMLGK